jgi:phenol/toluene 2-monooxygenase (NADH) P1/A1
VQYELRYQVIEPRRQTYQNVIDRFGDQPASRYLEGSLDVEPRENFHYRPTWAKDREIYDERFTTLRLSDSYAFLDPRQYFYTPYVTTRAGQHEAFGKTLAYLEDRELLERVPEAWRSLIASVIVPLRHFESGAQLVTVNGARFAYGTTLEQCCTYAAFDRIGNAQMLSRIGLAVGGGNADILSIAKEEWLQGSHLQPLRRLVEEIMAVEDWAEGLLAIDLVDALIYPLLYHRLDDAALLNGAGAYSIVAQHLTTWFADQRKWVDALIGTWAADPTHRTNNRARLTRINDTWGPRAQEAVSALVTAIHGLGDVDVATLLKDVATDRPSSWTKAIASGTGGAS